MEPFIFYFYNHSCENLKSYFVKIYCIWNYIYYIYMYIFLQQINTKDNDMCKIYLRKIYVSIPIWSIPFHSNLDCTVLQELW
jgi:hypothetical protein